MAGMDTRSVEVGGNAEVAGFDLKSICDGPEPAEKVSAILEYSSHIISQVADFASTGSQGS